MENLRLTIIQSDLVWENPERNLLNFSEKIEKISEKTDLIVLPEMFSTGFSMNPAFFSKNLSDEVISWMREHAKTKNCVLTGSVIYNENNKYYNRLIWMQADGSYDFYDKRHLFSFAGEDKFYTAGENKLICNIGKWRIRPLICYDLRFPVWSRNVNDYDVLLYVANWPERRIEAWDILLQARAIENQCYVAAVNRIGNDGNGIVHSGNSKIIDPKGNIISKTKAFQENTETIELSYADLVDFREKFRVSDDADDFKINL